MKIVFDEKLTIKLSQKAFETLNALTESSGFGSRGRTIEEAILAVDDLARLGEQVLPAIMQAASDPKQSTESIVRLLGLLNSFLTYYTATLARFRKPMRPSISPQVIPNATTSGGKVSG